MTHLRARAKLRHDATAHYVRKAARLRSPQPPWVPIGVMQVNDACRSHEEFCDVLSLARELAARDIGKERSLPRKLPWHAPTITEAEPLAVMAEPDCAELAREQEGEANKRRLLAEIELERIVRAAAGDTRLTYILCPAAPSNYHVRKVFAEDGDTAQNQSNRARVLETLEG
jgi:hypothetical protein